MHQIRFPLGLRAPAPSGSLQRSRLASLQRSPGPFAVMGQLHCVQKKNTHPFWRHCSDFVGTAVVGIAACTRAKSCLWTDTNRQLLYIVYGPPLFFNAAWCLTIYIFQTLVFAYCVQRELATQRGTGMVGNGWILCGTGRELFSMWLQLAGTGREWIYHNGTGRDGSTGYDFHSRVLLYSL